MYTTTEQAPAVQAQTYYTEITPEQQLRYALLGAAASVVFTSLMLTAFTVGCGKF